MRSLEKIRKIRLFLLNLRHFYYKKIWGMDLDPTCRFSLSAKLDTSFPAGVHIGSESYLAFGVAVLAHDMVRGLYLHTRIGSRCFIGARSLILPGITIGDGSIVAAGSVVTKDVPPRSIVAGNPARIIRENIEVVAFGRLKEADGIEEKCRAASGFDVHG